jgi:type IV pilus assembly protein PilM
MLQLSREGDHHVALAADSRTLGREMSPEAGDTYHQAVSNAVRDMLSSGKFQGRHAVSCLPAASLIYKNIRLPKMPHDELAAAVGWEASERLKLSGDAMNVQFFDAGEVHQGQDTRQEVIILAAPKTFIDDHIRSLKSCDLELDAIDVVPGALARCLALSSPDHDQDASVRFVIDVGYAGTKVLITNGQRICFFRLIEIGGRHMDEALASSLQLPIAAAAEVRLGWINGESDTGGEARIVSALGPIVEDLSREINLCLRYYSVTFRGRRPEGALVVGGESRSAWLSDRLCEDIGLKPATENPIASLDLAPIQDDVGGPDKWISWIVAAGLSLRQISAGKHKSRGAA